MKMAGWAVMVVGPNGKRGIVFGYSTCRPEKLRKKYLPIMRKAVF